MQRCVVFVATVTNQSRGKVSTLLLLPPLPPPPSHPPPLPHPPPPPRCHICWSSCVSSIEK